jgi:photosystem I reaction center subunit XII
MKILLPELGQKLKKFELRENKRVVTHFFTLVMPIADYQVFTALFLALATGIFAVRLGVALYK